MRIITAAKRNLRLLLDSPAGERFRQRYQRRQCRRGKPPKIASMHTIYKLMYLGLGILLFLFGIVMFPLPGPGWAICLLGLGLMAGEFDLAARLLDSLEMLIRRMGKKLRRP